MIATFVFNDKTQAAFWETTAVRYFSFAVPSCHSRFVCRVLFHLAAQPLGLRSRIAQRKDSYAAVLTIFTDRRRV